MRDGKTMCMKFYERVSISLPLSLSVLVVLLSALPSAALISFDPVTWGAGGETLGWSRDGGAADSVTSPTAGGAADSASELGYLDMTFYLEGAPQLETDRLITDNANMVGDFVNNAAGRVTSLTFDFLGYASAGQSVWFESDYGVGTSTWGADPFLSTTHAWESEAVSFLSDTGWGQLTGSTVAFAEAIQSVTRIGILVTHPAGAQDYSFGLDNWQFSTDALPVPEPGTIMMSLTALLGMLGIARKQIREGIASLRGGGECSVA